MSTYTCAVTCADDEIAVAISKLYDIIDIDVLS